MAQTDFTNLLIVVVVAFAAPFALNVVPRLRLPAVVLEIVAGIAVGRSVLGWVQIDEPVQILSLIGLAFSLLRRGSPSATKPAVTNLSPAAAILRVDDRALCRTLQNTFEATA